MKGFTTKIVHNDRQHAIEHGATHKPIHTSVAFGYADARDLAGVFQGTQPGYTYGRQVNPTVDALEDKVTVMEGGLKTICFSTGMAAIGTTIFALLRPGDHVVCSAFLFGNTNSLMNSFDTQGVDVTFVDATQAQAVADAIVPATKLVFVETIANPRTQVADLEGIGKLCSEHNLVYVVDNTMTSPYLFRSKNVGASLAINSLTKYIGGHGNALGGTVTELGNYDWGSFPNIYDTYQKGDAQFWGITQIRKKGLRDFGAALSPEAAHHIAIGAETLALRMARQCDNAARIAEFLDKHPRVQKVFYPGLADHAEHTRAQQLFGSGGAILSFELDPDIDIWRYLNGFNVIINSTNLGDNRTLAIPVAHTIYYEMGAERRKTMGIADSLIRLSVGIEDVEDLIEDLAAAFD